MLKKALMPNGKDVIPPLNIEVSAATQQAITAIKEAGGSVTCVYRTRLILRHHVKPYKWDIPPTSPQPSPKKLLELEAMKEKGAEVVYTPVLWFGDEGNRERQKEIEEGRTGRAEKLRQLGDGTRFRPMLSRPINYLPPKSKKGKGQKHQ